MSLGALEPRATHDLPPRSKRTVCRRYLFTRPGGLLQVFLCPFNNYVGSAAPFVPRVCKCHFAPATAVRILHRQVGFRSWEEVGMPGEGVGSFAKRSIHVFIK